MGGFPQLKKKNIFLAAGSFLLGIALFLGLDWDFRKLPRHVFRPSRSNMRGLFVNAPSGSEKVDWKKGYNSKYGMLFLQGRKTPLTNVRFPNLAKCMAADPEATVWPESMVGMMMRDPRGSTLRYIPASQNYVPVYQEDGSVEFVARNSTLSRKGNLSENLDELQQFEDLENAKRSGQERMQAEIHNVEQIMSSVGTLVSPLLQQNKKGGGGG